MQVELAQLTLGYTSVPAPADGYVTRKAVEPGNQVQAGQPLLAVVSLETPRVVANYKETQLHLIRPGQAVRLRVDALPGREFTGKVESIMAGTGVGLLALPAGERERQLREGRAAHPGADRPRRGAARRSSCCASACRSSRPSSPRTTEPRAHPPL